MSQYRIGSEDQINPEWDADQRPAPPVPVSTCQALHHSCTEFATVTFPVLRACPSCAAIERRRIMDEILANDHVNRARR